MPVRRRVPRAGRGTLKPILRSHGHLGRGQQLLGGYSHAVDCGRHELPRLFSSFPLFPDFQSDVDVCTQNVCDETVPERHSPFTLSDRTRSLRPANTRLDSASARIGAPRRILRS
ncbi:hypothetical protein SBA2_700010 [Acidobacteriia bacterium SbA2]|nr:hypothetical protein SBA2_700010 [Acidobacteriia bacterium SbA2]